MKLRQYATILAAALCVAGPAQAQSPKPPATLIMSGYEVGTSTYSQIQAVGNAINAHYGTQVRTLPFGDAVGRLLATKLGRSQLASSATDWYLAFEGMYDFASLAWGPQPLELLWHTQPTALVTMAVTAKSGIRTAADLKGKRVAQIAGSPALNLAIQSWLAFGGLTLNDVKVVNFSGYAQSIAGLINGTADATFGFGTTPQYNDLNASPQGLAWLPLPFNDKAGWSRMLAMAPHLQRFTARGPEAAIGVTAANPVEGATFVSPVIVSYAGAVSEDVGYFYIKAIDELYPKYKDAFPVLKYWNLRESINPQGYAPFHPGVVKYLKEKGIWNGDFQKFQDGMHQRRRILQAAWDKAVGDATQKGLSSTQFQAAWMKARQEALAAQQPQHPSTWWQPK